MFDTGSALSGDGNKLEQVEAKRLHALLWQVWSELDDGEPLKVCIGLLMYCIALDSAGDGRMFSQGMQSAMTPLGQVMNGLIEGALKAPRQGGWDVRTFTTDAESAPPEEQ